ncbi:MAG: tRNA (Guanine(26)-N(2)/guanine(27)-N(2))-dimethyltransferase [Promethearchaeota archaeon]|nr:MAG: tRNA (Guanine(26)-N(2)/guanine(27)-N(2))-dimethyltransferase [Candidatus Lokiarchaeota archaeon]
MTEKNKRSQEEDYTSTKEGLAKIKILSEDENKIPSKSMGVFYNEKMRLNRSITSLALESYYNIYSRSDLFILDTMAASGVGPIRLIKEFEHIKKIIINDINPTAIDLIKTNLRINNLDQNDKRIEITQKDANYLMNELAVESFIQKNGSNGRPDIISIDPFGTPNRYLDAAMKAIRNENGLLCITATDTAVLFGVKPKACVRKYMAKPLVNEFSKEIGARILLYFISRIANINNIGIEPLLSVYHKHFVRIFACTYKDKRKIAKKINKSYGYILHCSECNFRAIVKMNGILKISKNCPKCQASNNLNFAGPLWVEKLHNKAFVEEIYSLSENKSYLANKTKTILSYIKDEVNMPFSYYNIHKLTKKLQLSFVPKMEDIILAINEKGCKASRTHFDFTSIKTDITLELLEQILKNLQTSM